MKPKSTFSIVLVLAFMLSLFAGCVKDKGEQTSSPAPKDKTAQVETAIEDTTAEGTQNESGIFCGDYSVISSQIHLPNQEVDGDFSATSSAGAPLKEDYEMDYASSALTSEEVESANKELKEGYTLTYGCVATRVMGNEHIEKMRNFLKDNCKYWCLVDWVEIPDDICTVELDGNSYSLVENYMVENLIQGGGAYQLNRQELETFRNILDKSGVLAESIDLSIDKVIENIGDTEFLSGTPKDDAK